MFLGSIQGILHKGDAVGIRLERRLPLLGREVDEKRHLLENGIEGGLDVGGRERCVGVLVWSGGLLGVGLVFVWLRL